jgi:nitroreductase
MNETNPHADLHGARGAALENLKLITTRRARRRLLPDEIPSDSLLRILEAARWAPSCANNQPWKYYLCTGETAAGCPGSAARR